MHGVLRELDVSYRQAVGRSELGQYGGRFLGLKLQILAQRQCRQTVFQRRPDWTRLTPGAELDDRRVNVDKSSGTKQNATVDDRTDTGTFLDAHPQLLGAIV